MVGPINLNHPHRTERQRTLDKMTDQELQRAKRHPGAFGAVSPKFQREIDQEIEDRRIEREESLVTEQPFQDDSIGQDLIDDDTGKSFNQDFVEEYFYDEPAAEWSDSPSSDSIEDIDWDGIDSIDHLLHCECEVSLGEDGWGDAENHRESCSWSSVLTNDVRSESSSENSGSSGSNGSGEGKIHGAVIGGAVGSVGGPAGAAAGAAVGSVLGALFD